MAKKQLTPEEYNEKMEKRKLKSESFSNTFISAIAVMLSLAITFSVVSIAFTYAEEARKNNVVVSTGTQQSISDDNIDDSPVTDDSSTSVIGGVDGPTDIEVSVNPSEDNEKPEESEKQESAFASTEELVTYFNKCANKVKTDATKVVKNYEKRIVGELVLPEILKSTADSLLKTYMTDDTEPIVYDTKEAIRKDFLVPNQDYVSCLKASDVVKADCKDNGKEYVIYFKLKDEKNPKSGSGVGSVCDVIETYEVEEKAPSFLEEFSTYYYDCEVTATIDKATGRMTHVIYSAPLKLNVVVSLFGTHSASVGLTFVKDYTITY